MIRTLTQRIFLKWLCMATTVALGAQFARGQVPVPVPTPLPTQTLGGVYIDADGTVQYREINDPRLAQLRARARSGIKDEKLAYVSLPKLAARMQQLAADSKPIPDDLRYLGGLTQLRYIFVFPQEHDLIIAGPAEPIDSGNPLQPTGRRSGRPIMQFDDFIAALRTLGTPNGGAFGCSIDPQPDSLLKAKDVVSRMQGAPQQAMLAAVAQAIGPQELKVFGAPPDTRITMVCIAADYRLKRLTLGIDSSPVAGLSHAIDNSRPAGNRFWFELSYQPLLVDSEGNSFELRGQRLTLKCGALAFDEKGATATAKSFAKQFSAKFPELAAVVPAFAELQNVADLSVLSALIRHDRLDQKAGWDTSWLLDAGRCHLPTLPTPRSAQTLVCIRNGSLAAGGVNISPAGVIAPAARENDRDGALASPRQRARNGKHAYNPIR